MILLGFSKEGPSGKYDIDLQPRNRRCSLPEYLCQIRWKAWRLAIRRVLRQPRLRLAPSAALPCPLARSLAQPAPRCRATGQLAWTGPGRSCSFSSEAVACGGPAISKGNSGGSTRPRTGRNCLRTLTKLKRRRPWHIPARSAGAGAGQSQRPAFRNALARDFHIIYRSRYATVMQHYDTSSPAYPQRLITSGRFKHSHNTSLLLLCLRARAV